MASKLRDEALIAVRKSAQKIRAENPLLAAAFSEVDVIKAIIEATAEAETTLAGGISKALLDPSSARYSRNITKAMLPTVQKAVGAGNAADVSPRGFEQAIAKARTERAEKPNEPTRQGGGKL
jgi:hypothetical protein